MVPDPASDPDADGDPASVPDVDADADPEPDSSSHETVTLAFELAAIRQFADPRAVLKDARRWTESIGIVGDEPTPVIRKFGREHGYRLDFFSGSRTERESLETIVNQPEHAADRFVLVAADEELSEYAEGLGWEYLTSEEAAETAGWPLATEPDDDGEDEAWF